MDRARGRSLSARLDEGGALTPGRSAAALTAIVRSAIVLTAMLGVVALMVAAKHLPEQSRAIHRNEFLRLHPSPVPSVISFIGQLILLVSLSWAASRILKIRL